MLIVICEDMDVERFQICTGIYYTTRKCQDQNLNTLLLIPKPSASLLSHHPFLALPPASLLIAIHLPESHRE